MSLPPLLAQFLTALTGPWATGIAIVLLGFTGGVFVPGEPDQAGAWILHLTAAFSLRVLGANFMHVLGLLP